MADHPSLEGLKEAVGKAPCLRESVRGPGYYDPERGQRWVCGFDRLHPECATAAEQDYLRQYEVLMSGEGLVQKVNRYSDGMRFTYDILVPVVQGGGDGSADE